MDIIYKKVTDFDKDNNFLIDLLSNNQIANMFFKGKDEWLISGLDLKIETLEQTVEYAALTKVSDFIEKAKADRKNIVKNGRFETKLENFKPNFNFDILQNYNKPNIKTYKYYNTDAKKFETIDFPDYKKFYKEGKTVWDSIAYGHA